MSFFPLLILNKSFQRVVHLGLFVRSNKPLYKKLRTETSCVLAFGFKILFIDCNFCSKINYVSPATFAALNTIISQAGDNFPFKSKFWIVVDQASSKVFFFFLSINKVKTFSIILTSNKPKAFLKAATQKFLFNQWSNVLVSLTYRSFILEIPARVSVYWNASNHPNFNEPSKRLPSISSPFCSKSQILSNL